MILMMIYDRILRNFGSGLSDNNYYNNIVLS